MTACSYDGGRGRGHGHGHARTATAAAALDAAAAATPAVAATATATVSSAIHAKLKTLPLQPLWQWPSPLRQLPSRPPMQTGSRPSFAVRGVPYSPQSSMQTAPKPSPVPAAPYVRLRMRKHARGCARWPSGLEIDVSTSGIVSDTFRR